MPTWYTCPSRILRYNRSTLKNSADCARSDEKVDTRHSARRGLAMPYGMPSGSNKVCAVVLCAYAPSRFHAQVLGGCARRARFRRHPRANVPCDRSPRREHDVLTCRARTRDRCGRARTRTSLRSRALTMAPEPVPRQGPGENDVQTADGHARRRHFRTSHTPWIRECAAQRRTGSWIKQPSPLCRPVRCAGRCVCRSSAAASVKWAGAHCHWWRPAECTTCCRTHTWAVVRGSW